MEELLYPIREKPKTKFLWKTAIKSQLCMTNNDTTHVNITYTQSTSHCNHPKDVNITKHPITDPCSANIVSF